jgi:hypothetical protein
VDKFVFGTQTLPGRRDIVTFPKGLSHSSVTTTANGKDCGGAQTRDGIFVPSAVFIFEYF